MLLEDEADLMLDLETITAHYDQQGYQYHVFKKLAEVMKAIKTKAVLNDWNHQPIDIATHITDPNYRFATEDFPSLSQETSEALATAVELGRQTERASTVHAHERSIEVRKQKADEFALKMKAKIDQLKSEENISTYRDIVEVLNERGIPTAHEGGKWHLRTLADVLKRAKNLEETGHHR